MQNVIFVRSCSVYNAKCLDEARHGTVNNLYLNLVLYFNVLNAIYLKFLSGILLLWELVTKCTPDDILPNRKEVGCTMHNMFELNWNLQLDINKLNIKCKLQENASTSNEAGTGYSSKPIEFIHCFGNYFVFYC